MSNPDQFFDQFLNPPPKAEPKKVIPTSPKQDDRYKKPESPKIMNIQKSDSPKLSEKDDAKMICEFTIIKGKSSSVSQSLKDIFSSIRKSYPSLTITITDKEYAGELRDENDQTLRRCTIKLQGSILTTIVLSTIRDIIHDHVETWKYEPKFYFI
jgi:predicted glycosyltransferase